MDFSDSIHISEELPVEPVYRAAEKEWKAFIEAFTDLLAEVDAQVPHLPPNDVVHRIYRDVRNYSQKFRESATNKHL